MSGFIAVFTKRGEYIFIGDFYGIVLINLICIEF